MPLAKCSNYCPFTSLPLLTHYCAGDNIENNEMGGACSSDEVGEGRVQGFGGET
jgi:hypothetical protein